MHCDMEDMSTVVQHVHIRFPRATKLLVGFSAGANIVVKYLGAHFKENPFAAAVSVCNGHELVPREYLHPCLALFILGRVPKMSRFFPC